MPQRRNVSHNSGGQPELQNEQGAQMLKKRKELFIQQFEKEAQDRINEMEANLNKLLATVDRMFKVESMKMPQSLHTTLMQDLSVEEASVGEVTFAMKSASPEILKPLTRKPSKKVMVSDSTQPKVSGKNKKSMDQSKTGTRTKSLKTSKSTGSLRCNSTMGTKRTQSRVTKHSDQALNPGFKSRTLSASDYPIESNDQSSIATATISTSLGDILILSEENKDELDIELLDDQALFQMQRIKNLMDYMCQKVKVCDPR